MARPFGSKNRLRHALVASILRRVRRPVSLSEIEMLIATETGHKPNAVTVRAAMSKLTQRGITIRPWHGLYLHKAALPRGIASVRFKYPPIAA